MTIHYRKDTRCAVVTLEESRLRNALSMRDWSSLLAAVSKAECDDDVGALVLTGAGDTFCAGAHLSELDAATGDAEAASQFVRAIVEALQGIRRCAKPVIAAVNGPAVGGGAELALACDLRVGVPSASLRFPMVRLGVVLDRVTLRVLLRYLPLGLVQQSLFLSTVVESETAARFGLLAEITPPDVVLSRTLEIAQRLASLDSGALAVTRGAINEVIFDTDEDPAADMLASVLSRVPGRVLSRHSPTDTTSTPLTGRLCARGR